MKQSISTNMKKLTSLIIAALFSGSAFAAETINSSTTESGWERPDRGEYLVFIVSDNTTSGDWAGSTVTFQMTDDRNGDADDTSISCTANPCHYKAEPGQFFVRAKITTVVGSPILKVAVTRGSYR